MELDELDIEELKRQLGLMQAAGLGGGYMHAREGLITAYLGDAWMAAVRGTALEARRLGLRAWLYDEDRWPSGYGGGMAVMQDIGFRQRVLAARRPDTRPFPEEQVVYSTKEQVFCEYPMPYRYSFNKTAYIDLMNRKAVKAFIPNFEDLSNEPLQHPNCSHTWA